MRQSAVKMAVAAASCVLLSGCAGGLAAMPLPGGADVGAAPYAVTVQFTNALDLVPQTAVKVDGVAVGRVTDIGLADDGWTAQVSVVLDSGVNLPANSVARIEQTNLLGEKFISLAAPTTAAAAGRLGDGDHIPLASSGQSTEVEQVLGAMSLLLNGGGVGQLQPIVHELTTAFEGRESSVKELLSQSNAIIGSLNAQTTEIIAALTALDTLSTRTAAQTPQITAILTDLPAATTTLEQQRPQLVEMLGQLQRLGDTGTAVLTTAHNDLVNDLLALRPILQELGKSGDDLITAIPLMLTVPFPDGIEKVIAGGSTNLWLTVDAQIGTLLPGLGVGYGDPQHRPASFGEIPPTVDPNAPWYNGNGPKIGWPTVSLLPMLPPLPSILPPGATAPALPANPFDDLLGVFGMGG